MEKRDICIQVHSSCFSSFISFFAIDLTWRKAEGEWGSGQCIVPAIDRRICLIDWLVDSAACNGSNDCLRVSLRAGSFFCACDMSER
jgi:hypothetical protein